MPPVVPVPPVPPARYRRAVIWTGASTVALAAFGFAAIPLTMEPWQVVLRYGGIAAIGVGAISLAWMRLVASLQAGAGQQFARYEAMLERAPDGVLAVDRAGTIVFANVEAHRLLGTATGTLVGQPVDRFVPDGVRMSHAAHRDAFFGAAGAAAGHGAGEPRPDGARVMEPRRNLQVRRPDGSLLPVDITLSRVPDGDGTIALAFVRDVTAQRALWDDLSRVKADLEHELLQRQQLRALSELLHTMRSRDEVRSVLNLHLEHMLPGTSGAVLLFDTSGEPGQPLVDWGPNPAVAADFFADDCWAVRLGRPYGTSLVADAVPCSHVVRGQTEAPYLCVPMVAEGETLGVLHMQIEAADGTSFSDSQRQWAVAVAESLSLPIANLQLRETLQNQSIRDALTGAFNRRYLEEALARELARATRGGYPISVVMIDLDHFKQLNDVFGHAAGDAMLRRFVDFATERLRAEDILCRYGGEEFAIVMPGSKGPATVARLEQMRCEWEALATDLRRRGQASTTFSVGVSVTQNGLAPADRLLKAADRALYEAKAMGRNRVIEGEAVDTPVRVINPDR